MTREVDSCELMSRWPLQCPFTPQSLFVAGTTASYDVVSPAQVPAVSAAAAAAAAAAPAPVVAAAPATPTNDEEDEQQEEDKEREEERGLEE